MEAATLQRKARGVRSGSARPSASCVPPVPRAAPGEVGARGGAPGRGIDVAVQNHASDGGRCARSKERSSRAPLALLAAAP
jgi:hypothetical protein